MRRFPLLIAIIWLLLSAACAPADISALASGDIASGTCEIEEAGFEIEYIEKYDRTVFVFWVEDGDCAFD